MNPKIFREYDVRGVADRDLTDEVVRAIGYSIGELACVHRQDTQHKIVIGRDCRLSSPRIFAALTGVLRSWADVIDIGIVPTPVAYFAQQHFRPAATVMVTGSHNPGPDNGLKIMIGSETIHGGAIIGIRDRAEVHLHAKKALLEHGPRGDQRLLDVVPTYLDQAYASIRHGAKRPKVVVDGGNGAGGPTAVQLYSRLGFDVVPLYCDMDGSFPNHHPDPTQPENLVDLIRTVQRTDADLGIALDGDADRVGVVTASGQILWGDQLMILLGRAILAEDPSARFVAEVKCSQALYDALPSCEMWRVGHSLIKARVKETGAALAGEMSGHLFFANRWLGFDDGIYAGARVLELLSQQEQTLDDLLHDLPHAINTPEIRIDVPEDRKFQIVATVTQLLEKHPQVADVCTIDGIRATFAGGGWGLVRASNTQAALIMRCEASDRERLEEIKELLTACIEHGRS